MHRMIILLRPATLACFVASYGCGGGGPTPGTVDFQPGDVLLSDLTGADDGGGSGELGTTDFAVSDGVVADAVPDAVGKDLPVADGPVLDAVTDVGTVLDTLVDAVNIDTALIADTGLTAWSAAPTTVDFQGPPGGPFTPAFASVTLQNTGTLAVSYAASTATAWLVISPAGGQLQPGTSLELQLSVNAIGLGLPLGEHHGTVGITAAGKTEAVSVTLSVGNNGNSVWTKSVSNPHLVKSGGGWDSEGPSGPAVLKVGGAYMMWFAGTSIGRTIIGLATSVDGVSWTRHASNPIITGGGIFTEWNYNARFPTVIHDAQAGTYQLWYVSSDSLGASGGFGYAASTDGIHWTSHPSPVLEKGPPGSWKSDALISQSIILDNGTYRMWFVGSNGTDNKLGYATSTDGLVWTEHGANPVALPSLIPQHVEVVKEGGTLHMWVFDTSGDLHYTSSSDGLAWASPSATLLSRGSPFAWDGKEIHGLSVLRESPAQFRMWYGGQSGTDSYAIGLATNP